MLTWCQCIYMIRITWLPPASDESKWRYSFVAVANKLLQSHLFHVLKNKIQRSCTLLISPIVTIFWAANMDECTEGTDSCHYNAIATTLKRVIPALVTLETGRLSVFLFVCLFVCFSFFCFLSQSKGAQVGCLRLCCLLERFWIHNPVDVTYSKTSEQRTLWGRAICPL